MRHSQSPIHQSLIEDEALECGGKVEVYTYNLLPFKIEYSLYRILLVLLPASSLKRLS